MSIQFGIDIILKSEPDWKTRNIALLTNDAAKTINGTLSRKALKHAGFNLVKLFSPEHGMLAIGKDGARMENEIDEITGLPIISLYGDRFMPTEKDLAGIDILLFDIPDVGSRFYTYLWSMTYWIQAAAQFQKKVIILDRPNPLGGELSNIEGPLLDDALTSFIGRFSIPIRHHCTYGELARYFNATQNWNANLMIIPCEGWKRKDLFYDWNTKWINPSPALQNIEATILYPGLCFFEATNVSVGRGTAYSFEWIGAEWMNISAITLVCQNILSEDLKIENRSLMIHDEISNSYKQITGIRLKVIDPYHYPSVMNGLVLLKLIKDVHPQTFKWKPYPTLANPSGHNHLSLLLGIPNAEKLFDEPLPTWLQQISKLLRVTQWKQQIEPYLMYS
jgi:uncharacterized protein YbbC (DUF1343 family)